MTAPRPNFVTAAALHQRLAEKCAIIPLGVDVDRFQQADPAQVADIRAKGRQHPILLFVGRLRYYKGLDDLLRAMALLRDTRDHLTATLLICGSGPMEAAWRALAQELGLTEQVHFLGDVPEETLPALYHAADLYVLPANSRAEAFGVALLEAMAAGLPVISTEIGTGTSYVNIHGETGLIVPPRDPERLAQAIAILLNDPALRQRLGAQAQARVRAKFSQATMIERVLDLYSEVSRQ